MDVDENFDTEMCKKRFHNPNEHSARTFGHVIQESLKKPTKYPQKVVKGPYPPPLQEKKYSSKSYKGMKSETKDETKGL